MPRILVIEDDVVTGLKLEETLSSLGFDVILHHRIGPALSTAGSEALAYGFIDVNLDREDGGLAVAEVLQRRGVPFVLATGYGRHELGGRYSDTMLLPKPYYRRDIVNVLQRAGLLPGGT